MGLIYLHLVSPNRFLRVEDKEHATVIRCHRALLCIRAQTGLVGAVSQSEMDRTQLLTWLTHLWRVGDTESLSLIARPNHLLQPEDSLVLQRLQTFASNTTASRIGSNMISPVALGIGKHSFTYCLLVT